MAGGIRARKSRRNKRVNTTKPGLKRKKKAKKVLVLNQTLKKNWDQKKTLKQNFHDMGLAFDANAVVPMRTSNKEASIDKVEKMEVEKLPTNVVEELEEMASVEEKKERHIPPGEAQFIWKLIQVHGDNYKAMARDKANYYQHTPKQLKRKCEAFLRSSQDFSKHLSDVS